MHTHTRTHTHARTPQFDAVLAANLVCRLPEPMAFFDRLPSLVKPGGIAVIVSPHSWLAAWTPKGKWMGGYNDKDGKPVMTADVMAEVLGKDFDLVAREDMPFLIREHVRKYQWGCSNAMVWRRKAN
jgi:2-polyprenyl-3-methyl-5-hydroxy-6-metoxy-1,4-benzoquinol methylase